MLPHFFPKLITPALGGFALVAAAGAGGLSFGTPAAALTLALLLVVAAFVAAVAAFRVAVGLPLGLLEAGLLLGFLAVVAPLAPLDVVAGLLCADAPTLLAPPALLPHFVPGFAAPAAVLVFEAVPALLPFGRICASSSSLEHADGSISLALDVFDAFDGAAGFFFFSAFGAFFGFRASCNAASSSAAWARK